MDICGGAGISKGPRNLLANGYFSAPISITVEGANIITRSLIVIGQAVLRSHPFFKKELEAFEEPDTSKAIKQFDTALSSHVGLFIMNGFRAIFHNMTIGLFTQGGSAPQPIRKWYKKLSFASIRFAFLADFIVILYQNKLKKKQKIGGRITDALSELYLMSCVLKRFEEDGMPEEDYSVVRLCLQNGLHRFEKAMTEAVDNIDVGALRPVLRLVVSRWGTRIRQASDKLGEDIATNLLKPSAMRDRLTRYVYIPNNTDEAIGTLEAAMRKSVEVEPLMVKVEKALRKGELQRYHNSDWITEAQEKGILNTEEASLVRESEKLTEKAIAVDHFDPKQIHGVDTE